MIIDFYNHVKENSSNHENWLAQHPPTLLRTTSSSQSNPVKLITSNQIQSWKIIAISRCSKTDVPPFKSRLLGIVVK
ncbi:hypothetical protein WN51_14471 [Melipona quadrifasciata]|uniref:Uncharacterized protein n=1 Tax=Melipona quadrifasciata TaxID=166423 RepID=A0A0M8ZY13_9HYME|nr:hypothetical protein WN51_14471 [Melipona quadrifasciata]